MHSENEFKLVLLYLQLFSVQMISYAVLDATKAKIIVTNTLKLYRLSLILNLKLWIRTHTYIAIKSTVSNFFVSRSVWQTFSGISIVILLVFELTNSLIIS